MYSAALRSNCEYVDTSEVLGSTVESLPQGQQVCLQRTRRPTPDLTEQRMRLACHCETTVKIAQDIQPASKWCVWGTNTLTDPGPIEAYEK
jgi:hypothetical protein